MKQYQVRKKIINQSPERINENQIDEPEESFDSDFFFSDKQATIFLALAFGIPFLFILRGVVYSKIAINSLTLAFFAFFLGMTFELNKLNINLRKIANLIFVSFVMSLGVFLYYSKESPFLLKDKLEVWPTVFLLFYISIVILTYKKTTTAKIGEGVTLLHSKTLFYFIYELSRLGKISETWVTICSIPFCFSIFHSLTHIELTKLDKLWLRIWSSIAMAVFGVLHITKVWNFQSVESYIKDENIFEASFVFFEYFLFGASAIYIVQNLTMLLAYLPSEDHIFSNKHFDEIDELNKAHIDRYSSDQVDRSQAFFCSNNIIRFNGFKL